MRVADLLSTWRAEEQRPFTGWDFGALRGRMLEDAHPWSYSGRAAALLDTATAALDMDTGGGERLLALRAHWPPTVVATEAYPPNVRLARQHLEPHGIRVVETAVGDGTPLPFADGTFDLVLNRHGNIHPGEVARVLTTGGVFFTEQVHGLCVQDLLAAFDVAPPQFGGSPERYVPQLEAAGLRIVQVEDWSGGLSFTDIGALVYYLKAIPWLVPGFTEDSHAAYLLRLQERFERAGLLTFTYRVYLMEAVKVGASDGQE